MTQRVLILYYSRLGSVASMARLVARGVESVDGCEALIRTVADIRDAEVSDELPEQGDSLITTEDLDSCDALILGSPTRFGNMAAPLKYFLDQTSAQWLEGRLVGKPAAVFTSSSSIAQE